MRRPGVEPGSLAWKAGILTTILPTHITWTRKGLLNFVQITKELKEIWARTLSLFKARLVN